VANREGAGEDVIWCLRERCGKSEEVHSAMKSDLAGGQMPSGLFGVPDRIRRGTLGRTHARHASGGEQSRS
jgi:hypothetical protein